MKFTTLVPLKHNDGSPVGKKDLNRILRRLQSRFGGLTVEGHVAGRWIEKGELYQDESLKISIACDNSRLEEAQAEVLRIGRQLGQLAMFFEVQYYDGVQILRVE